MQYYIISQIYSAFLPQCDHKWTLFSAVVGKDGKAGMAGAFVKTKRKADLNAFKYQEENGPTNKPYSYGSLWGFFGDFFGDLPFTRAFGGLKRNPLNMSKLSQS